MSEDPNALPDQPEEKQPGEAQSSNEPNQEQPAPAEQYPPLPSFYEQAAAPDPYSTPDPYGAPAAQYNTGQPGYGVLPFTPDVPPLMPPPGYGMSPFMPHPEYGFMPPAEFSQPLPLGQAIRELPGQYKKILRKPSAWSFATEQSKADWGIIWMQLLFMAVLELISALLALQLSNTSNSAGSTASSGAAFATIGSVEPLALAIFTPVLFFAGVGIQYLFAKMFKGVGQFKQQAYNTLLYQMPMAVFSAILALPLALLTNSTGLFTMFSGNTTQISGLALSPSALAGLLLLELVGLALFVYSVILNIHAIMATHRLSGGKASGVVLLPYGVFVVLYFVLIIAIVASYPAIFM